MILAEPENARKKYGKRPMTERQNHPKAMRKREKTEFSRFQKSGKREKSLQYNAEIHTRTTNHDSAHIKKSCNIMQDSTSKPCPITP